MCIVLSRSSFLSCEHHDLLWYVGKASKRTVFVRELVREVVGFAPYEKRVMEYLRIGKEKRALKFAKSRLGTHKRGKDKREELSGALVAQRRAAATAAAAAQAAAAEKK